MLFGSYLKSVWSDLGARMTGGASLILLFAPMLSPKLIAEVVGSNTLVLLFAVGCLVVSSYRAWLAERRARQAERLDPLVEDVQLIRELWARIQYDHKDSTLIRFPLAGFNVEKWEEVHKQLLRLFSLTSVHASRARSCFARLGISDGPRIAEVMNDQSARHGIDARGFSNLLEDHDTLLKEHRKRILG